MCQKGVILFDSVDLAPAQNCQVDLTHALGGDLYMDIGVYKCVLSFS